MKTLLLLSLLLVPVALAREVAPVATPGEAAAAASEPACVAACRAALQNLLEQTRAAAACAEGVKDAETADAAATALEAHLAPMREAQEALTQALDGVPEEGAEAEALEALLDEYWPLLCDAVDPLARCGDEDGSGSMTEAWARALNSVRDVNALFADMMVSMPEGCLDNVSKHLTAAAERAESLIKRLGEAQDAASAGRIAGAVGAERGELFEHMLMACAELDDAPTRWRRALLPVVRRTALEEKWKALSEVNEALLVIDGHGSAELRTELETLADVLQAFGLIVDGSGVRMSYEGGK